MKGCNTRNLPYVQLANSFVKFKFLQTWPRFCHLSAQGSRQCVAHRSWAIHPMVAHQKSDILHRFISGSSVTSLEDLKYQYLSSLASPIIHDDDPDVESSKFPLKNLLWSTCGYDFVLAWRLRRFQVRKPFLGLHNASRPASNLFWAALLTLISAACFLLWTLVEFVFEKSGCIRKNPGLNGRSMIIPQIAGSKPLLSLPRLFHLSVSGHKSAKKNSPKTSLINIHEILP